jgi:hypothetical protein
MQPVFESELHGIDSTPFEALAALEGAGFRSIEYFLLRMLIKTRERIFWKEDLHSFTRSYS